MRIGEPALLVRALDLVSATYPSLLHEPEFAPLFDASAPDFVGHLSMPFREPLPDWVRVVQGGAPQ